MFFVNVFLFLFVLKEFNLFAHHVSNCVSFFVKNKERQVMVKD